MCDLSLCIPNKGYGVHQDQEIYFNVLSLTNSTLLAANMILMYQNYLDLTHDSHFLFHIQMCILLQFRYHRLPIWPPALPLNLTYIR
jgi:hypothetical protein